MMRANSERRKSREKRAKALSKSPRSLTPSKKKQMKPYKFGDYTNKRYTDSEEQDAGA